MYLSGAIADGGLFLIVQEEEEKKSNMLSGRRNHRLFVFPVFVINECHKCSFTITLLLLWITVITRLLYIEANFLQSSGMCPCLT